MFKRAECSQNRKHTVQGTLADFKKQLEKKIFF